MSQYPSVDDTRCIGPWACIELVADKKIKAPLAGFNDSIRNVSGPLAKIFMDNGLYLYCNWDYIFISPPIIISRPQIDEMFEIVEKGLKETRDMAETQDLAQVHQYIAGMGHAPPKFMKQKTKVKGALRDMKGKKSVGVVERDQEKGILKIARPIGVIGAPSCP